MLGTRIRTVAARVGNDPFVTFIGLVSLVSGASYTAGAPLPGSLDAALPLWFLHVWGVYLMLGGAAVLSGVVLLIRRAFDTGLWLLGGGIAVYATVLLTSARVHGAGLQAGIDLGLAAACVVRATRGGPWTRP